MGFFFFPIYFVTRVDFNTSYTGEMVIQFDGPALKQQQKNAAYVDKHTHRHVLMDNTWGLSRHTLQGNPRKIKWLNFRNMFILIHCIFTCFVFFFSHLLQGFLFLK